MPFLFSEQVSLLTIEIEMAEHVDCFDRVVVNLGTQIPPAILPDGIAPKPTSTSVAPN